MPTHNGRKVFRPQGRNKDYQRDDWDTHARKAVSSGGRVVQTSTGDIHLVSPSGSHWGTYKAKQGLYEGATLNRLDADTDIQDITDRYS